MELKREHLWDKINRQATYFFAKKNIERITPFVSKGDRILDIGSGYGKQAHMLKEATGCDVTAIDVVDYNRFDVPFKEFDGVHVPFEDSSFDVSYLAFVLHHAEKPIDLLRDALRVTKRTVLIFEDTPRNAFDWALDGFHGKSFNWYYKLSNPTVFRTQVQWEKIFSKLPIKSQQTVRFKRFGREPYFPISRSLFILEK